MSVEFFTNDYVFNIGHAPRGCGSWAFSYKRHPEMADIIWINGMYSEAKRIMRARAVADGQRSVFVQP